MIPFYEHIAESFDPDAPRVGKAELMPNGRYQFDPENPDWMDTQMSRFVIARCLVYLAAKLPGQMTLKHTRNFRSTLHRLMKNLWGMEIRNFTSVIVRDLRLDAAWRARVLSDLGGWRAMRTWRERFARRGVPPQKRSAGSGPSQNITRSENSGAKTDRDGLFRLQRIISPFQSERTARSGISPHGSYIPNVTFKPIELHPDELEYAPTEKKLRRTSPKVERPCAPLEWLAHIMAEFPAWIDALEAIIVPLLLAHIPARIDAPP